MTECEVVKAALAEIDRPVEAKDCCGDASCRLARVRAILLGHPKESCRCSRG